MQLRMFSIPMESDDKATEQLNRFRRTQEVLCIENAPVVTPTTCARSRVACLDHPAHMNNKIKQAQHEQIPFMLIAGEREMAEGTVAVRRRGTREQEVMPFERFVEHARKLRETWALEVG